MLEGGREKEEKWNIKETGRVYMYVNREERRKKVREDKQTEGRGGCKIKGATCGFEGQRWGKGKRG